MWVVTAYAFKTVVWAGVEFVALLTVLYEAAFGRDDCRVGVTNMADSAKFGRIIDRHRHVVAVTLLTMNTSNVKSAMDAGQSVLVVGQVVVNIVVFVSHPVGGVTGSAIVGFYFVGMIV